jgi:hypothetical protein
MRRLLNCLILCTLTGLSSIAFAQEGTEVEAEKAIDWNLQIIGATFLGNNSYFGESEEFYGANTDNWSEGVFELGVKGHSWQH